MKTLTSTVALIALLAGPLAADEISDTLQSAMDAYNEGDTEYALEELEYAKQLMVEMKTDALSGFLPEAPEGWSRVINNDMGASLAMLGGGVGTDAEYTTDTGEVFTLTIMADNPMVGAMAGMIGNAGALGAKVERVGRQKFMVQDGDINGLVDKRILVQASGAEVETMLAFLATMDFKALSRFGR